MWLMVMGPGRFYQSGNPWLVGNRSNLDASAPEVIGIFTFMRSVCSHQLPRGRAVLLRDIPEEKLCWKVTACGSSSNYG